MHEQFLICIHVLFLICSNIFNFACVTLLGHRTNFMHAQYKIERLSADATFCMIAHTAKMKPLLTGTLIMVLKLKQGKETSAEKV